MFTVQIVRVRERVRERDRKLLQSSTAVINEVSREAKQASTLGLAGSSSRTGDLI